MIEVKNLNFERKTQKRDGKSMKVYKWWKIHSNLEFALD